MYNWVHTSYLTRTGYVFISGDKWRSGEVKLIAFWNLLKNQGYKQLWKYRWQSLARELLSKGLIESSCQGGCSNQRTCVFQVERGHVESMINLTNLLIHHSKTTVFYCCCSFLVFCCTFLKYSVSTSLDVQQSLRMSEEGDYGLLL